MKIAIFLTVTIAVTLVSAHPVEKRQFRDLFRNITAAGVDALSDLFDFASDSWGDLRKRIQDYDIGGRIADIRQRVRDRYGPQIDRITNLQFDDIARAARDVIGDARDVLHIDDIVGRIRKALGREVDDVSDDDIGDIVEAIEDDVTAKGNDGAADRRKRGFFDTLRAALRNITSAGSDALSDLAGLRDAVSDFGDTARDTLSSVVQLAARSWATLRQRLQTYDVRSRLTAIQQRVLARFGDQVEQLSDVLLREIAVASKGIIEGSSAPQEISDIVPLLRSSLGSVLDAVSDIQIGQVIQGLQDDVTAVFGSGDNDDNDDNDGGMRKRGLRDDFRHAIGNLTSLAKDTLSDIIDLARLGWKNLQQRIQNYNIPSHLDGIRQKIRDHLGSFVNQIQDSKLQRIIESARDIIAGNTSLLEVDSIVEEIRSRLGSEVKDMLDDEIAEIVLTLEDDVSYDASTDDVDRSR